jgi:quinol monooxygenase YgiN
MGRIQILVIAGILGAIGASPILAKAEPVIVTVKLVAAEGRESELQERNLKLLKFLREAEPSATFRLHRSVKSPKTFLWYEIYPSQSAHETHLKEVMPKFRKEFGPAPKGLMIAKPEVETYIEVGQ